jgi:hypothetical protein
MPPSPPTTSEVEAMLVALAEGRVTRVQASSWAEQWVMADDSGIRDGRLWRGLIHLAGADLISTDRPYLHGEEDFQAWLEEFRRPG